MQRKTVFACFAEKRGHLVLLVKRFHMQQMEAVHALLSSFVLGTPCVHTSREEEMYQRNSTNELVVPNAARVNPTIYGVMLRIIYSSKRSRIRLLTDGYVMLCGRMTREHAATLVALLLWRNH